VGVSEPHPREDHPVLELLIIILLIVGAIGTEVGEQIHDLIDWLFSKL
jgi:hypothetical protein